MKSIRACMVAGGLVLLGSAGWLAAQNPPEFVRAPQLRFVQLGNIRAAAIEAPAAVKALLPRKKALDVTLMQRAVSYRGAIPMLTLNNGRQITLLPVEEPVVKANLRSRAAVKAVAPQNPTAVKPSVGLLAKRAPNLAGRVISIAAQMDHRGCQTPIRDQGSRGTCTAFASVAAIEAYEKCEKGVTLDLSENDAYHISSQDVGETCAADAGVSTYQTAQFLTNARICQESQMPYTPQLSGLPANDATHVPGGCQTGAQYGFTDTQVFMGTAFGGPAVENANNPDYLETLLKTGRDVVYGLYVAGTDWNDGTSETGVVDVQTMNGSPAPAVGGHAMLLVGFDHAARYFIFKNSWSAGRGHAGYFYLSYDYIQTYGKYGYVVKGVAD